MGVVCSRPASKDGDVAQDNRRAEPASLTSRANSSANSSVISPSATAAAGLRGGADESELGMPDFLSVEELEEAEAEFALQQQLMEEERRNNRAPNPLALGREINEEDESLTEERLKELQRQLKSSVVKVTRVEKPDSEQSSAAKSSSSRE